MSSRDQILARIKTGLAKQRAAGALADAEKVPPVPQVWPIENPPIEEMVSRFDEELKALGGELLRAGSIEEARAELTRLMEEGDWKSVGGVDRPLCRELGQDRVTWVGPEGEPKGMSELDAGLIEADFLLADTGTCLVSCDTPQERIMCYMPPVSIVIATTDRLAEHMPAVWENIARRTAEPARRGEFVLITGPSRTADIEKILILGVHGPKRLIVLLVG